MIETNQYDGPNVMPAASQVPSTQTTGSGSANDPGPLKRRRWRRVPLIDKLKLEAAINFGLPVDFAGKVIGLESSNTDRIMKDLVTSRETDLLALQY